MRASCFVEKFGPLIVAIPFGACAWLAGFNVDLQQSPNIVGGSLTVAAIFVGFLVISKGILLSYKDSRVFVQLRDSGHLLVFANYIRFATHSSLLWIGASLALHFTQSRPLYSSWCFLAVLSLASFARIAHIQRVLIED